MTITQTKRGQYRINGILFEGPRKEAIKAYKVLEKETDKKESTDSVSD